MKKYIINRTHEDNLSFADTFWQKANTLYIDNWPWHKEKYSVPKVYTKLLYSDKFIFLNFHINERFTRSQYTKYQEPVCQDSCVEFFVSPDNKQYFNFEINAIGTMLFCIGKDRHERKRISSDYGNRIEIITSFEKGKCIPENIKCPETGYNVAYAVPLDIFCNYFNIPYPSTNTTWKANFYKCGDMTKEPSWGCWNPIETENPDFHRPEYFGEIIFE